MALAASLVAAIVVIVNVSVPNGGGPGHPAAAAGAAAGATHTAIRSHPAPPSPRPVEGPIDPGRFAPGACVAFGPTRGDRHLTVFLDAGHGGIDPGGVGTTESGRTVTEAKLTLPIELDTMALLRAKGFRVVVSRTRDTTVLHLRPGDVAHHDLTLRGALDDVAARDVCANLARADVLVGIYFDAESSPYYAGCVTGYDTARPFAAANGRLARLVQHDVLSAMNARGWGIPDQGAVTDTALGSVPPTSTTGGLAAAALAYNHLLLLGPAERGYFSTPSRMPGAVIEPLYITDPFEASIAASAVGQHTIAAALARALVKYSATLRRARSTTSAGHLPSD